MRDYQLHLEFPINEGYIWVQIDEKEISSAPVAMCVECGDSASYCELKDCIGCDHRIPLMMERKERICALYDEIFPWLEDLALEFRKRVREKLEEIGEKTPLNSFNGVGGGSQS